MVWLKQNYKTVTGALVILILLEMVVAWYLIEQFHENYLSGEDAFAAALSDAGLARDAVSAPDIDLKTKQGRAWYVVTFSAGDPDTALRYQVDAETGEILSREISPGGGG